MPAMADSSMERRVCLALVRAALGVVLAGVIAWIETGVVADAWYTCDRIAVDAGGGFALLFCLCALWASHSIVLAGTTTALTVLVRPRPIVLTVVFLAICVHFTLVSWAFFAYAGLPHQGDAGCPDVQPNWWPQWLPPRPEPFFQAG
jgi:hypothetical protein